MTKQANKTENGLNEIKGGQEMKNTQGGKTMKQTKGGKTVMDAMNNGENQGGNAMETKKDPRVVKLLEDINCKGKGMKALMDEINNPKEANTANEEVKAEEVKEEKVKRTYVKRENAVVAAVDSMMMKEAEKLDNEVKEVKVKADKEVKVKAKISAKIEVLEAERAVVVKALEAEGLLIEAQRLLRGEITLENYDSMVQKVERAKYIIKSRLNKIYRIAEKKAEDRKARKEAKVKRIQNYVGVVAKKLAEYGEEALSKELLSKEVTIENADVLSSEATAIVKGELKALRREYKQLQGLVKESDRSKTLPELRESIKTTGELGNHKVEKITDREKAVLLSCLSFAKENQKYNRFAFLDKKRTSELLKKYTNGLSTISDMYLKGFRCDLISKAYNEKFAFEVPTCEIDLQDLAKDFDNPFVQNELKALSLDSVEKLREIKIEDITNKKSTFADSSRILLNSVLKNYDSSIVEMYKVFLIPENLSIEEANKQKRGEIRFRIVVDTKILDVVRRWSVDLPYIGLTGVFETTSSIYYCSYIPLNLEKYIDGDAKRLLLNHPLRYILEKALSKYEDGKLVPMTKDEFFDIVNYSRSENIYKLQKNVKDIMIKAKNNVNDEDLATPLLWTPKLLSMASTYGRRNTVLMETLDYSSLSKIQDRHIEGLDYLTGSTSLPAKRATLASGYKFMVGSKGTVTIIPGEGIDLSNHVKSYLSDLNLIHLVSGKTGGKRNNGPTMSWAYNLVNPQRYERHVVNKDCTMSQNSINSILNTLFVAKIHLPENLSSKLVKLGLYPNTNDCFLLTEDASRRMATYYAKAHEDTKVVYPSKGSKFYGICRDKGSISALLTKYAPMVDYKVHTKDEALRLIEALKLMRGDDIFYNFDEDKMIVSFVLDVIANPSTGRDNVGAILLQSALETRAMLDGKVVGYTTEEVAKMKVEEEVSKVELSHRVYLVDIDYKEVFDFGNVTVIMEDFFWQPQHDNRGYIREKNVNIFYNQGIAGLHTFAPIWHKNVLNSAKFDLLKQTMLALNLGFANEVNNKTTEETLNKVDSLENYLVTLGFDEEVVEKVKEVKTKTVDIPKFETSTGILRTFDPKLGISKERLYNFFKENVSNCGDIKSSVLDMVDLSVLSSLMSGESGSLIKDLLWNNVKQCKKLSNLIDWINSKNIFKFELEDGEERVLFLPFGIEEKVDFFNKPKDEVVSTEEEEEKFFELSEEEMSDEEWEAFEAEEEFTDEKVSKYDFNEGSVLDYKHMALINVGLAYYYYLNAEDEDDKAEKKAKFLKKINQFNYQLRTLFSKEFKTIYNWQMNGISGVILPANKGIDGAELPQWYCMKHNIKIGDKVLVFRDPIQGLILELEVRGYTSNEIRIHSTILTWIGGDHDGDKVQIVPVDGMIADNSSYIENEGKLREELDTLLPSHMLDNPLYVEILSEKDTTFELDNEDYSNDMLKLLAESKKSSRYYGPISMKEYFEEYQNTVLNMRTVKEGTATAGSFANWLYEVAELMGLDLVAARTLGDRIQQLALDSKHTQGGNGFRDSMWYALSQLRREAQKSRVKHSVLELKLEIALGNKVEPKASSDAMEILFGF